MRNISIISPWPPYNKLYTVIYTYIHYSLLLYNNIISPYIHYYYTIISYHHGPLTTNRGLCPRTLCPTELLSTDLLSGGAFVRGAFVGAPD